MGIRLFVAVLDNAPTTLSHRERLLLGVLAEDANDDTAITWSSVQDPKIRRRADLSRTQLYEVLKTLTAKGMIKKLTAGQRHSTAKYVIQCPAGRDATETAQSPGARDTYDFQSPAERDAKGRFSVPESGTLTDSQSPAPQDTDDSQCPAGRDVSVPLDGTPTPLLPNTSISPAPPAAPAPTDGDLFADFWTAYPKKVGKGNARKAWTAALKRGAEPAAIVAAAESHASAWQSAGTDKQWIPYPSTWLNGERYDDADLPSSFQPPKTNQPQRWSDPADQGVF
ncbi:hypothetical protein [Streptacidiphilus sp. EB103A]|uniref:hypothetical protein n=1 Tax=Streptacidiphilus sp. EB103A TaxID=3156275 RepID=UPI0035168435